MLLRNIMRTWAAYELSTSQELINNMCHKINYIIQLRKYVHVFERPLGSSTGFHCANNKGCHESGWLWRMQSNCPHPELCYPLTDRQWWMTPLSFQNDLNKPHHSGHLWITHTRLNPLPGRVIMQVEPLDEPPQNILKLCTYQWVHNIQVSNKYLKSKLKYLLYCYFYVIALKTNWIHNFPVANFGSITYTVTLIWLHLIGMHFHIVYLWSPAHYWCWSGVVLLASSPQCVSYS